MKIVACSDIHLSDNPEMDNFGIQQEEKFLKFCDNCIKEKIDIFIINGDLYELWQGDGRNENERLKLIRRRYEKIEDKLMEMQESGIVVHKIFGNHDYFLRQKENYQEEIIIKDKKNSILFYHGYQHDFMEKNKILSWISKKSTEVYGILEKIFGVKRMSKILNWIENLKIRNKVSARNLEDDEYIYQAIEYAKKKNVNMVCLGHVHSPKIEHMENILYINSGCWIDGNTDFVYIDDDNIALEKF